MVIGKYIIIIILIIIGKQKMLKIKFLIMVNSANEFNKFLVLYLTISLKKQM